MTTRQLLRLLDQGHHIAVSGRVGALDTEHAPRSTHDPLPWRSARAHPQEGITVEARHHASELTAVPLLASGDDSL